MFVLWLLLGSVLEQPSQKTATMLSPQTLYMSPHISNPDLADFWVRQSDANIGRAAALAAITRIPNPAILYGLGSFLLTLDTENDIIVSKVRKIQSYRKRVRSLGGRR